MWNRFGTAIRQFAIGATCPSLPALLGAILVAVGLFVLCVLRVTPDTMATPVGQLMTRKTADAFGQLTVRTLCLRQSPPQGMSVVLIGDSMVYQAIPQAQALEQALRAHLHAQVPVHILAAGSLTQWEALPLTDVIGDRIHGVIVLEISPFNIAMDRADRHDRIARPRLALDSPSFLAEAMLAGEEPPRHTGNYFLDHYAFFATRVDSVLTVPAWYSQQTPALRNWTPSQWNRAESRIASWVKPYAHEAPRNMDVYARMINRLRQRPGIAVALLEGAENPRNETIAGQLIDTQAYARYRQDIGQFAERIGVPYWDIAAMAQLTPDNFADYAHIANSLARRRYIGVLAEYLARLIVEKGLLEEAHP